MITKFKLFEENFEDRLLILINNNNLVDIVNKLRNGEIDEKTKVNGDLLLSYSYSLSHSFEDEAHNNRKYLYEFMKTLLEKGSEVNIKSTQEIGDISNGDTLVIDSYWIDTIDGNDFKFLKLVMKYNPDINIKNDDGYDLIQLISKHINEYTLPALKEDVPSLYEKVIKLRKVKEFNL